MMAFWPGLLEKGLAVMLLVWRYGDAGLMTVIAVLYPFARIMKALS
jgi:hypothetical protein